MIRQPNYPTTQLPDNPTTRQPNYPTTQLPDRGGTTMYPLPTHTPDLEDIPRAPAAPGQHGSIRVTAGTDIRSGAEVWYLTGYVLVPIWSRTVSRIQRAAALATLDVRILQSAWMGRRRPLTRAVSILVVGPPEQMSDIFPLLPRGVRIRAVGRAGDRAPHQGGS